MEFDEQLPADLRKTYDEIRMRFAAIVERGKSGGEILQDESFLVDVVDFVVRLLNHCVENFEVLNLKRWIRFLYGFYHEFHYGPNVDDFNYLDTDNCPVGAVFSTEMNDWTVTPSKARLLILRDQFLKVRATLNPRGRR